MRAFEFGVVQEKVSVLGFFGVGGGAVVVVEEGDADFGGAGGEVEFHGVGARATATGVGG